MASCAGQLGRVPLGAAALAVAVACTPTTDLEGLQQAAGTGAAAATSVASSSGAPSSASGTGGNGNGASGGSSGTGGTAGGGGAPSCPGGDMVAVPTQKGHSCVDATEVTQYAYWTFLSASPDPNLQIQECVANDDFSPTCSFSPLAAANYPVVCVDWCDAYAYCGSVGKRLCGRLDGGSNPVNQATDADQSQWYRACSMAGSTIFPYGNVYQPTACNGVDALFFGFVDVATFAQCVGGYPGLYDMSGNVREWEDSCSGDTCVQRGGSWLEADTGVPHSLRCDSSGTQPRSFKSQDVGFRCCADPT